MSNSIPRYWLETKMFCNKPTLLFNTKNPDLFITYEEGFNIHSGKRNPLRFPENVQFDRLSN